MDPLRAELERAADRMAAAFILLTRGQQSERARSNMTAKIRGLPSVLDKAMSRIDQAYEAAGARLDKAVDTAMKPVARINEAAQQIEDHAADAHEQIDSMLRRSDNGGPPLDETLSTSSEPSDGADRPLT